MARKHQLIHVVIPGDELLQAHLRRAEFGDLEEVQNDVRVVRQKARDQVQEHLGRADVGEITDHTDHLLEGFGRLVLDCSLQG